jgi:hypothetical protein
MAERVVEELLLVAVDDLAAAVLALRGHVSHVPLSLVKPHHGRVV